MIKIMDDSLKIEGLTERVIKILEDITNLYEYDLFIYHEFSCVLYDHSEETATHDSLGYYVGMIIEIRREWLEIEKNDVNYENIDDILEVHEEIVLLRQFSELLNK